MNRQDHIKFDPVKIAEIASEIQLQVSLLRETLSLVKNHRENITYFWHGTAADEFNKKMKEVDVKMELANQVLVGLYTDIFNAAGIYEVSESITKLSAEELPIEGVFR
jgi:uncharacterized protein YukE